MTKDWVAWHEPYEDDASALSRRVQIVRRLIADQLDEMPAGPIKVVSICAGQGHDLLEVLSLHPRAADVRARLVELDPVNVEAARARRDAAGLDSDRIEIVAGDAADPAAYDGLLPAHLVIACGIFGNLTDRGVESMIRRLPELCARDALVLWTRHRGDPDLTPSIRRWFADAGFTEITFESADGFLFGVGANRWATATAPSLGSDPLFHFVGYNNL